MLPPLMFFENVEKVDICNCKKYTEMLDNQLNLLAEHSLTATPEHLVALTNAMVGIVTLLCCTGDYIEEKETSLF